MTYILKRLLQFFSGLMAILAVGLFMPATPRASTSHLFSKIDKDNLLDSMPSPRMILIGGSNLSMSLDSRQLMDSLKYNPVNTGLSASLGLLYMLDHSLLFVRAGDIVIISPEYSQFYEHLAIGTEDLPRVLLDTSPSEIFDLRWFQFVNSMKYLPRYSLSKFKPSEYSAASKEDIHQVYQRKSFNQFGDMNRHWLMERKAFDPLPVIPPHSYNPEVIDYLSEFRNSVEKKGGRVYVTFPALNGHSFKLEEKEIEFIESQFKASEFTLLGNPKRYRMPDSVMFDTPYHLTKKGVDLRTHLLIEDLRAILSRDYLSQNPASRRE